jgi:hypothetical protein
MMACCGNYLFRWLRPQTIEAGIQDIPGDAVRFFPAPPNER